MTFIHSFSSRQVFCVDHTKFKTIADLKEYLSSEKGFPKDASFFICNGSIVDDTEPVQKDVVYHTYLRLLGGKGGFGSMLRAIGAQIEKTTNHEACRDLSGRRMRDVNNEKDLKDWLGKQAEREHDREQKRRDRIARRRAMPNHKFDDPLYHQQRSLLAENQEDALQTGLKKTVPKAEPSATVTSEELLGSKRKCHSLGPSGSGITKKKKATEWLGVDIDTVSDLDSDEDNSNIEQSRHTDINPKSDEERLNTAENSNSCDSSGSSVNERYKESIHTATSDKLPDTHGNIAGSSDEHKANAADSKIKSETVNVDIDNTIAKDSLSVAQEEKALCLDAVTSVQDLVHLGLDRLKQELLDRGLKCGGTLGQRAERLFSVKGLTRDQIDPTLFSKSANGKKVKNRH